MVTQPNTLTKYWFVGKKFFFSKKKQFLYQRQCLYSIQCTLYSTQCMDIFDQKIRKLGF